MSDNNRISRESYFTMSPIQTMSWKPTLTDLGSKVDEALAAAGRMNNLCGEIIATLRLPRNTNLVSKELRELAEAWNHRFNEIYLAVDPPKETRP